jgi:tetratricopeptide (TPR) repeat protein
MKKRYFLFFLVLAAVSQTASRTRAQEKSWKGESVLATKAAKDIKFGDVVDGKEVFFSFSGTWPIKVRDEREGWLRIYDGHREGWVDKADFVLEGDAPAFFQKRVQANPKDSWALHMRGAGWLRNGESDSAIQDFNECIRLNPKDSEAFNSRGVAWSDKMEYDKAIGDYDQAIRLDPKYVAALNNRGNAWSKKKDYDKAIRDYDRAIRLDPKKAVVFDSRGVAWSNKKEYDKAIRDYDEAIRLDPKYVNAFKNRGNAWSDKKDYDKAIRDYDEAIRFDPKYVDAFINRGHTWSNKKEYDKAIRDFDEAIRLDPKYSFAFINRGNARSAKKEYDRAIRDFDEAIRLDPKEAYAVILGHFAARRAADSAAALRFLKDSARNLNDTWPYPVVRFLRDEVDEPQLLNLATDDDKRTEAHCYIGLDQAIKGREERALAHLHWVKEHGNTDFIEYSIALAELERLEGATKK